MVTKFGQFHLKQNKIHNLLINESVIKSHLSKTHTHRKAQTWLSPFLYSREQSINKIRGFSILLITRLYDHYKNDFMYKY